MEARKYLSHRRQRVVGEILGFVERADWYTALEPDEKQELRQKVLDAIGVYHDCVLDVVRALDGDGVNFSERALELLGQIHSATSQMAAHARTA